MLNVNLKYINSMVFTIKNPDLVSTPAVNIHTLHIHCTYTAHTLHIHCTYTAHTLHIHCTYTAHTLHIHCTYTVHTLHIQCTYTAHTLHIHCTYTAHTLHIHRTYTAHTLHIHRTYTPANSAHCAYSTANIVWVQCIVHIQFRTYDIVIMLPSLVSDHQSHYNIVGVV